MVKGLVIGFLLALLLLGCGFLYFLAKSRYHP
jgi:tetrahydromethanopterin S-methyltransferase subunit F